MSFFRNLTLFRFPEGFRARFVLMAGEVGRLLDAIETTFSVNRPESL